MSSGSSHNASTTTPKLPRIVRVAPPPILPESTTALPKSKWLPSIPLFRDPQKAAKAPLDLGLTDTSQGKASWRASDDNSWYALSKLTTHKGSLQKVGDVDDGITCMHLSDQQSYVQKVRWTATVFNEDGATSTLPKFRDACLAYCRALGCVAPPNLFLEVDPTQGQRFETAEAIYDLKKIAYKIGYGWEFTITSK